MGLLKFCLRLGHRLSLGLLAVFLLSGGVAAQELARDQQFVWDDFAGGLNTKLSAHNLPKKQATIAENVRFDKELKSLTKRDDVMLYGTADDTECITGMHRLYLSDGTKILIVTHGDEVETGSGDRLEHAEADSISLAEDDRRTDDGDGNAIGEAFGRHLAGAFAPAVV